MNINNITNYDEIWVEMGQFSTHGRILGDTKNLKIGDRVKVLRDGQTAYVDIEECTLYEYGEFEVQEPIDKEYFVFWAIPISNWWKD